MRISTARRSSAAASAIAGTTGSAPTSPARYRSKSDFDGLDIAVIGPDIIPDNYTAKKSEWLALVNGYVDLGTWHGITPFVGAGVGAANVKISDFTDVGVTVDSVAFGDDHDEWNFAWAVYAGLGFEVTDGLHGRARLPLPRHGRRRVRRPRRLRRHQQRSTIR